MANTSRWSSEHLRRQQAVRAVCSQDHQRGGRRDPRIRPTSLGTTCGTVSVQAGQIVGGAVAGAFVWVAGANWAFLAAAAFSSTRSVLSLLLLGVDFLMIAAFNVALAPLVQRLYGNESWLGILDVCFADQSSCVEPPVVDRTAKASALVD
jgi:predicted phage tail protein